MSSRPAATGGDPLSIALLGDIMPGGDFSERCAEFMPSTVPAEARSWLEADVVLANLECPFSDRGAPPPNKMLHHALPEALEVLRVLGIDAVNLANNHIFDYGLEALRDTTDALENLGVGFFGAGRDLAEASAPWVLDSVGGRVAALGFSWTHEWVQQVTAATDSAPGVNPLRIEHVLESIDRVKREHQPRVVVVSLHWGEGMSRYPRPDSVRLARRMIDGGADIVMGHHPHCLQPVELYGRGVIFYSLGNFLASPSRRTPDDRLTYGEGRVRTRTRRQRLTALVRVTRDRAGDLSVDHLPLIQRRDIPVLRSAGPEDARQIHRALLDNGSIVTRRGYRWRYPLVRRWDEIRSKVEQVREDGFRDLTWRTPFRAIRRLVTGRNMH